MTTAKAFDILELDNSATSLEIKKAYRKLAMIYHPDRNPGVYTQDKFIEVSEAYEFLKSCKTPKPSKTFNTNPRNKFRNKNHGNHYNYNSYKYTSYEEKSQRAKEAYEKEFAEQSDVLYHKLFNKYKNTYQRKLSIIAAVLGLITITIFLFDYYSPTQVKRYNVSNESFIKHSLLINIDTKFDLTLTIDNQEYILTVNQLQTLKSHLFNNKEYDFGVEQTKFLHNNLNIYIIDKNTENIICDLISQGSNINNWLFLIFTLMIIPTLSFFIEKPSFNFVFFIVNYNVYIFPIILIFIIIRATPIIS